MSKSKSFKQKAKKPNQSPSSRPAKSSPALPAVPQWTGQGFVGYQNGVSKEQLQNLLNQFQPSQPSSQEPQTPLSSSSSVYFLKWIHQVSGMVDSLKNLPAELPFPSPEGQMFTDTISLRWQQRHNQYDVIIFSSQPLAAVENWQAIAENDSPIEWETRLLPALLHDIRDPQYPNLFIYRGIQEKQIYQRLFRNAHTSTVHFVTLAYQNL
jgi:hypothetical protein